MKQRFVKYLVCLILPMLVACEVKIPETIIQPDKIEALLYDYHLVQAMSADAKSDYMRKLYAEYVFDKHGVTKEKFDSSMVWYTRNPKHLYAMYNRMYDKLLKEVELLENENNVFLNVALADSTYMLGDTVNLWQGLGTKLLSPTPLMNRVKYSYEADSTYKRGDSIVMKMDVLHIARRQKTEQNAAIAAIMIEYADSTYRSNGIRITDNGHYAIAVPRNYDSDIKEIRGHIYYSAGDTLADERMLIGNIAVMRLHPAVIEDELDAEAEPEDM